MPPSALQHPHLDERPEPNPLPYQGAIVVYMGGGDAVSATVTPLAAIVVDVNAHDVNLQVFGTIRVFPRHNVKFDSQKRPNTWHWRTV